MVIAKMWTGRYMRIGAIANIRRNVDMWHYSDEGGGRRTVSLSLINAVEFNSGDGNWS